METVLSFLREHGAETIDHPGGTLYEHLRRVSARLAVHGASRDLTLAALAHAVYGTDGFDRSLVPLDDRPTIQHLLGERAELLVYRYAACDRSASWPDLATTASFTDRFTGSTTALTPLELREFVDLSIVNELDVMEQSAALRERFGSYLRTLFLDQWAPVASPVVVADVRAVLPAA